MPSYYGQTGSVSVHTGNRLQSEVWPTVAVYIEMFWVWDVLSPVNLAFSNKKLAGVLIGYQQAMFSKNAYSLGLQTIF